MIDFAVVGAGPAGCAAAVALARGGARVALLERAAFPRRKACGEGILPAGVEALKQLGVLAQARAAGREFQGVRWSARDGRGASGDFPFGHGLAVPRETLDLILLRRAAAQSGVELHERAAVESAALGSRVRLRLAGGRTLEARTLVAADGRGSPLLRGLGKPQPPPRRARFGLSARVEGIAGLGPRVEIFLVPGGEIYLTPLRGRDRAAVAVLLERAALPRWSGGEAAFWAALRACPALSPRLDAARLEGLPLGAGPLAQTGGDCEGPGWLAVGDAGGCVDPLVGDGIGLALRGAAAAAEILLAGGPPGAYTRRRADLLRRKRLTAAAALALSRRPALARPALAFLARAPRLFSALLAE